MKRIPLSTLCGLVIIYLGLSIILGWYFHIQKIITTSTGSISMVFNTALCFTLAGSALYLSPMRNYEKHIYIFSGALIAIISGTTLYEYVFHLSLGIDQLFIKPWLIDQKPYPGRMAFNTSIAFTLTGLTFLLFSFAHRRSVAFVVQISIFLVMMLSIFNVLGYLLKLEYLYNWYQYTRMSIHATLGMTILSFALWSMWSNSRFYEMFYHKNEDKKILFLSSMIVIIIATISLSTGFSITDQLIVEQKKVLALILGISIFSGIVLLYWQVLPLIRQLVDSRKEALNSNLRLRAISDHTVEGILTISTNGIIESMNQKSEKIFGYQEEELLGKHIDVLFFPRTSTSGEQEKTAHSINDFLLSEKDGIETIGMRKTNEQFAIELTFTKVILNNEPKLIMMLHDISDKKIAEAKAMESEARFKLAFDYSPIGIAIISLQWRWTKVNAALCNMLGYSEAELFNMDFKTITHPEDLEKNLYYIQQLLDNKISFFQMEKRYICKNKSITWVSITIAVIHDEKNTPLYYFSIIQDINDKKRKEEKLSYQAYYDALTGLVNRNQLKNNLDLAIATSLRSQQKFSVFFIDIDHFKEINDTLGHDVGDVLLKIIGDRLVKSIRKSDIAARLGGDEFILILSGVDNPEAAAYFAEKIINNLFEPITIKDHELNTTASIGICFYPQDGIDYQSLIKSADLALYKAKENGRNNYQFCTPEINKEVKDKISIKNALQIALQEQQFHLVFLPRLNLKTNCISAFEALLRWKNKQYGDVPPNKIISLIEEMGLMSQLSEWIITTASNQLKRWHVAGFPFLKMAINISPKHFAQADFPEKILQILDTEHIFPQSIEMEISESLIMQNPDYSLKIIHHLKQHDIKIIIDNFGTGYTSLNYLHQFSVDYIKIDQQFTHISSDQQAGLLTSIIGLAKNLNIGVFAAGVESRSQYNLLRQLGCDEIQGFYVSHPIVNEHVPLFLNQLKPIDANQEASIHEAHYT